MQQTSPETWFNPIMHTLSVFYILQVWNQIKQLDICSRPCFIIWSCKTLVLMHFQNRTEPHCVKTFLNLCIYHVRRFNMPFTRHTLVSINFLEETYFIKAVYIRENLPMSYMIVNSSILIKKNTAWAKQPTTSSIWETFIKGGLVSGWGKQCSWKAGNH